MQIMCVHLRTIPHDPTRAHLTTRCLTFIHRRFTTLLPHCSHVQSSTTILTERIYLPHPPAAGNVIISAESCVPFHVEVGFSTLE